MTGIIKCLKLSSVVHTKLFYARCVCIWVLAKAVQLILFPCLSFLQRVFWVLFLWLLSQHRLTFWRKKIRILVLKPQCLWGKPPDIISLRVSIQMENSSPTTAFVLYIDRMWAILIPCMNAYGILQSSFSGTTQFELQHHSRWGICTTIQTVTPLVWKQFVGHKYCNTIFISPIIHPLIPTTCKQNQKTPNCFSLIELCVRHETK